MRRWFDSLFARVLLMQAAVALLTAALFALLTLRQQAMVLAHATAPQWAAALRAGGALPAAGDPPRDVRIGATVALLPGPPPQDATPFLLLPRLRALKDALLASGVPVRELQISGRTGESVVWLALDQPTGPTWVGVRSEFEGTDARERGGLGFALAGLMIVATAWWLTRRVVRPLAELRLALQRFQAEGVVPHPPRPGGPAELRDLAQQLAAFAQQRQDTDRQRRTMLAGISHDLRSPLARIRMAAEFLPGEGPLAARREAITRNVQTADRLLGAFIDMARSEEEVLDQRVDLRDVVAHVRADAAAIEPGVQVQPLPEAPLWVQPAHAAMLERAVRNLIDNARMHGHPPLELQLRRSEGHAWLSVRDHGPGIPAAERQLLCEPFQRGESSRGTPGTGLGLAIVQRTAERHRGRLELADARPGLQATLVLPLG